MAVSFADIQIKVAELVRSVLQEWDEEDPITPETYLIADLGFASIDFVQLVVDIEESFGQKLGFQELLMPNGKYVNDLSFQELTRFVESRLGQDRVPTVPSPQVMPEAVTVLPASERLSVDKINQFLALIPRRPPQPATRPNPSAVFILSPPRCGSTLLRVILAGHPALFAPPELHLLMYDTLAQRKAALSNPSTDYLLEGTVRALMQIQQCSAQAAQDLMQQYEEQGLTAQQFYYQLQQQLGDRLLVDKTPSYALSAEVLNRAEQYFQDALYIHLARHPYGAIRSYEDAKLERLTLPFISELDNQDIFSRREFAELMWTVSQQNISEFLTKIPQKRWIKVGFEEMVNDPKNSLINICDFLNLEFLPEALNLYDDKTQRMTDGVQSVSKMGGDLKFFLHKGIDSDAAHKWKQYHTVDFLSDTAWQVAERLGYKRS
jgi:acyl carrier protein